MSPVIPQRSVYTLLLSICIILIGLIGNINSVHSMYSENLPMRPVFVNAAYSSFLRKSYVKALCMIINNG